jgi:hypothetical protein
VDGVWKSVGDSDAVCKADKDSAGKIIYVKGKVCMDAKYGGICPGNATELCTPVNGQWSGGINDVPCVITTTLYASSYPKEGLTSNDSAGGKASASSVFNKEEAWKAFNDKNIFWHSDLSYDPRTGRYSGKIKTTCYENDPTVTREVYGEWVQIELPLKILPQSLSISPRQDGDEVFNRSPVDFLLLASNDGKIWRVVFMRTGEMWKNKLSKSFTFTPKTPLYDLYSTYRLVVLGVGMGGNSVQIGQVRIIPDSPYYQTIECTPPKYGGFGCPTLGSKNALGNLVEVDPLDSNKRRSQCARPNKRVQYSAILPSGQRLSPGDSVVKGDYTLLFEQDGNLILLWRGIEMKWQSNTNGNSNCQAKMQTDGNFTIYNSSGQPLWTSDTSGTNYQLVLAEDGTLSIASPLGARVKVIYQTAFVIVNTIEKEMRINTTGSSDSLLDPKFKYFMVGPWIAGSLPITTARQLPDGRVVYMSAQGGHVKMVTNTGEARYFPPTEDKTGNLAKVENFDPNAWATYTSASDNYRLRICDLLCKDACFPDGMCMIPNTLYSGRQVPTPVRSTSLLSPMHRYRMVGNCLPPYGVPIANAQVLLDGRLVYIVEDDGYTKMVTNTGEARYYGKDVAPTSGKMSEFDPTKWTTYKDGNGCYKLSITPVQCPAPISTSDGQCPVMVKLVEIVRTDNKSEYINVAEVETYGIGPRGEEIKLPYNSGVTSPPFDSSNTHPWQNVQDGNLNNFAHTANAPNAFIGLILTNASYVSRVVVYNRVDACCKNRLNGCVLRLRGQDGTVVWERPFPVPEQDRYEFTIRDIPFTTSLVGCQSQPIPPIVCPPGKIISNAILTYGRWNNNVCPHPTITGNQAQGFKRQPISDATGKNSFSGISTTSLGDPVPNVFKHWEVTYSCIQPANPDGPVGSNSPIQKEGVSFTGSATFGKTGLGMFGI